MKGLSSLLAVLLLLSSPALAQTSTPSPSPEAAAQGAGAVSPASSATSSAPAAASVPFVAGAKVFLEPMDGFEQLLADAFVKKRVPVVVVKERAQADFILSGDARVKKRGWVSGFVLSTKGGGEISIKDARTGSQVFAYSFHRVDAMTAVGQIYENWAEACAKHLKKALEKR